MSTPSFQLGSFMLALTLARVLFAENLPPPYDPTPGERLQDEEGLGYEAFIRRYLTGVLTEDPNQILVSDCTRDNLGGNRAELTRRAIASAQYRTMLVRRLYLKHLGRDPESGSARTPGPVTASLEALGKGVSIFTLRNNILISEEYWKNCGFSHAKLVNRLFDECLTRAPDPDELDHYLRFLKRFDSFSARKLMVQLIANSRESTETAVKEEYKRYLERDGTPTEIKEKTDALQAGKTFDWLIFELVGTEEFQKAVK